MNQGKGRQRDQRMVVVHDDECSGLVVHVGRLDLCDHSIWTLSRQISYNVMASGNRQEIGHVPAQSEPISLLTILAAILDFTQASC